MPEFIAPSDLSDLIGLDDAEAQRGFVAATEGAPEPHEASSRSYWVGWRNGAAAVGHIPEDGPMLALRYRHQIIACGGAEWPALH